MRYIHNVAAHETFVASGIYSEYVDQTATGLVEEWSIHQQPDGSQMIRADHDARQTDGSTLLLEAYRDPSGAIQRFDAQYFARSGSSSVRQAAATFTFMGEYVHIGRTLNLDARSYAEMPLPSDAVISPPAWVFMGEVVSRLSEKDSGKGQVFTCTLTAHAETLLTGVIESYQARFIAAEDAEVLHQKMWVRRYELSDAAGGFKASASVNDQGLLVSGRIERIERSGDLTRRVQLTQLARRPER